MKIDILRSAFVVVCLHAVESTNLCPGVTTTPPQTTTSVTPDPSACLICAFLFDTEWNNYLDNGKDVCIIDAVTVTACFDTSGCDALFFTLIGTASDYLYDYNDIDTNLWESYEDVMDTYYEKCPNETRPTTTPSMAQPTQPQVAYFLNLDTSIMISSNMSIGETVYTIRTNDDSASLAHGIVLNTNSTFYEINGLNELEILVKSHLMAGINETLEFVINYPHSCGPGTLTISVTDMLTSTVSPVSVSGTTTSASLTGEGNGNSFLDDATNVALVSTGTGLGVLGAAGGALFLMSKKGACRRKGEE